MLHQFPNGLLHRVAVHIEFRERLRRWSGRTNVGLFVGIEFGIDHQAMLQVVDTQRGRFSKADGAKMAGQLQPARVGRRYGRLQFSARDVHICFERVRAHAGPILHKSARVAGIVQLRHLRRETAVAFQISNRDEHLRPRHAAVVNHFFQVEICIGLKSPGSSSGGYSRCQI